MHANWILDSIYFLGSLWGGSSSGQVCPLDTNLPPVAAYQVVPNQGRVAGVTAFVDVNVVPMDRERVLANQTVVVEGGRITALGPVSRVKIPAGAVRVDGGGKYLMPGLADMHNGADHSIIAPSEDEEKGFADQLFRGYFVYGVTGLRSLRESSRTELQQLQRIFTEYPVPRMYLAVELLPALNSNSLAAAIAAVKAAGYTHIIGNPKADSLTMALLRRGRLPMATHSHGLPFPDVLKLGASGGSAEHLYVFWDSLLGRPGPSWQTLDYINGQRPAVTLPMAKVPGLVMALKRAGVWVTPTLRCMENTHPYITDRGPGKLVKAMQDGGVPMLLGGDGMSLSRWSVHAELVAMVQAGLTPYQALLTGTRNVAEYFGILDSTGTIAVGKQADLVLLNDDPLKDVKSTWEPAGVMIAGRWFDRATLDRRLVTSPRRWFEGLLGMHIPHPMLKETLSYLISSPPRTSEQWDELERRIRRVFVLADSLDQTNRQVYTRTLSLISAELGAIRTILAPGQREAFDINLHVWLREQARQGYPIMIPGVAPVS